MRMRGLPLQGVLLLQPRQQRWGGVWCKRKVGGWAWCGEDTRTGCLHWSFIFMQLIVQGCACAPPTCWSGGSAC